MLTSRDHGTIEEKIGVHSLDDAEPSLAFAIKIPVFFDGIEARLTIELRYPGVSGFMDLSGRKYEFDAKNRLHGMSDGQTYVRAQVFADIRTAGDNFDTFINDMSFREARGSALDVEIKGYYVRLGSPQQFDLVVELISLAPN